MRSIGSNILLIISIGILAVVLPAASCAQDSAKVYLTLEDYKNGVYKAKQISIRKAKLLEQNKSSDSIYRFYETGGSTHFKTFNKKYIIVEWDGRKYVSCIVNGHTGYGPIIYESDKTIFYIDDSPTDIQNYKRSEIHFRLDKATEASYTFYKNFIKNELKQKGLWDDFKDEYKPSNTEILIKYLKDAYE